VSARASEQFWVPLTDCYGTNSLQVESAAGAADFQPIDCAYGTAFRFRGNACEHFTLLNVSGRTRTSTAAEPTSAPCTGLNGS
jgi:hypothetical protein